MDGSGYAGQSCARIESVKEILAHRESLIFQWANFRKGWWGFIHERD